MLIVDASIVVHKLRKQMQIYLKVARESQRRYAIAHFVLCKHYAIASDVRKVKLKLSLISLWENFATPQNTNAYMFELIFFIFTSII